MHNRSNGAFFKSRLSPWLLCLPRMPQSGRIADFTQTQTPISLFLTKDVWSGVSEQTWAKEPVSCTKTVSRFTRVLSTAYELEPLIGKQSDNTEHHMQMCLRMSPYSQMPSAESVF